MTQAFPVSREQILWFMFTFTSLISDRLVSKTCPYYPDRKDFNICLSLSHFSTITNLCPKKSFICFRMYLLFWSVIFSCEIKGKSTVKRPRPAAPSAYWVLFTYYIKTQVCLAKEWRKHIYEQVKELKVGFYSLVLFHVPHITTLNLLSRRHGFASILRSLVHVKVNEW